MKVRSYHIDGTTDDSNIREDTEADVAAFLANGGKIIRYKEDDGSYNKALKRTEREGGFNPFTKDQVLREG